MSGRVLTVGSLVANQETVGSNPTARSTRLWSNGMIPGFQPGGAGSIPASRST